MSRDGFDWAEEDSGLGGWGDDDKATGVIRVPNEVRARISSATSRMRWGRVALAVAGMGLLLRVVLSGTAAGGELEHVTPGDDFIGPLPLVGYSPKTNAERLAEAKEALREADETDGSKGEFPDEILSVADGHLQHEGDLDFTDANRDNTIARAVSAWQRPTWNSSIDWEKIKRELIEDSDEPYNENWAPIEGGNQPDGTVDGYDDVVRVSFNSDEAFTMTVPSGEELTHDGAGCMSGNMAVCPDLVESQYGDMRSVYALDREAVSEEAPISVRFGEGDDSYATFSCVDRVVPADRKSTMLFATVAGTGMREASIWRRQFEAGASRRDDLDRSGRLYVHMTAIAPPGMLSMESVFVGAASDDLTSLHVKVSSAGARIWTDDDRGLAGTELEMRVVSGRNGEVTYLARVLDTEEREIFVSVDECEKFDGVAATIRDIAADDVSDDEACCVDGVDVTEDAVE